MNKDNTTHWLVKHLIKYRFSLLWNRSFLYFGYSSLKYVLLLVKSNRVDKMEVDPSICLLVQWNVLYDLQPSDISSSIVLGWGTGFIWLVLREMGERKSPSGL